MSTQEQAEILYYESDIECDMCGKSNNCVVISARSDILIICKICIERILVNIDKRT